MSLHRLLYYLAHALSSFIHHAIKDLSSVSPLPVFVYTVILTILIRADTIPCSVCYLSLFLSSRVCKMP